MSVYIITHKKFDMKIKVDDYKILLVGAHKGHIFGDCFDDEGLNISIKNSSYCELTGLYWLWKNCQDEYVGIVHYRRFFTHVYRADYALNSTEIKRLLKKYDIILPFHARYQCTIKEDYCKVSGKMEDLVKIGDIIHSKFPEYYSDYIKVINGNECHLYNMMICNKEFYDNYCEWLFSILFELEKNVDLNKYNDYQKRIYGFLAERLLNVWVLHNRLKYCEVGVIPTEESRNAVIRFLTGCKRSILYKTL